MTDSSVEATLQRPIPSTAHVRGDFELRGDRFLLGTVHAVQEERGAGIRACRDVGGVRQSTGKCHGSREGLGDGVHKMNKTQRSLRRSTLVR